MQPVVISVLIPLLNPNEPEARLVSVDVQEGQHVSKGDVLCTLETTKSTSELVAEIDGYITGLHVALGDTVMAGDILCHLADNTQPIPEEFKRSLRSSGNESILSHIDQEALPAGLRITQSALAAARLYDLDLNRLPTDTFITSSYIQKLVEAPSSSLPSPDEFDPTKIIIYGGGGHSKSLIEMVRTLGELRIHGIIDDKLNVGESVMGCPVLGGEEVLSNVFQQGIHQAINAVGGIGNIQSRVNVFQLLGRLGFHFPMLIHPSAVVESSALLSPGTQVFPHAYIGSETRIGFGTIINTGAVISHDCLVGDYANISPGALLAGGVKIGERTLVGMGVTINLGVSVGPGVRIGNSATVKADIPAGYIIRAGMIWPE